MIRIYFSLLLLSILISCTDGTDGNQVDSPDDLEIAGVPVQLPDSLANITNEHLAPILPMLGDARIIGLSEGTHGMIEPFKFRNALIKYLVEEERISVIALESGLVESRLIYDYVNGANLDLDSTLNSGICCGFSRFQHNRELLEWLRAYNSDKTDDQQVHIYGFDIPGCAPNPELENAVVAFNTVFDYLEGVDPVNAELFQQKLQAILPLLRIKDNPQDTDPHFTDIDSTTWKQLEIVLTQMDQHFNDNSSSYQKKSSVDDYQWAGQALFCANQNVDFLHSLGNPDYDYSPREKGQLENIQWILNREQGENILLFAHLAHLAKEIHMPGESQMTYNMAGEYLKEVYGKDYKVIGNFYRKLDWFDDDPIVLEEGTMAFEFQKLGCKNFYMALDKSDTTWTKEWNFGKPSSGGKVYMNPSESVDIIYYNDVQTWIDRH